MQISFQTHTGHGCLSAVRLFRQTWTHCWLYRGPNYRPPHSPPPENRASTHSHTVETDLLNVTACWAGTRQNCAPPSSPEWATRKWADVLGEAADTRWPGSLNWHRFASDEESDEDRMVYEFASKSGGRQLTGNVSARHQNSKKAHFSVSYLYSV